MSTRSPHQSLTDSCIGTAGGAQNVRRNLKWAAANHVYENKRFLFRTELQQIQTSWRKKIMHAAIVLKEIAA